MDSTNSQTHTENILQLECLFFANTAMQLLCSTPYVGMALKKMAATLKVHKWHAWNVRVRLVKGLHEPYQALPSAYQATETLPSLESIAKVPDQEVAKTGKSSIFWLSFFFFVLKPF